MDFHNIMFAEIFQLEAEVPEMQWWATFCALDREGRGYVA